VLRRNRHATGGVGGGVRAGGDQEALAVISSGVILLWSVAWVLRGLVVVVVVVCVVRC